MNIYDYKVKDGKGNDVSLADYKGKVLLIVNTATACGLTPQYEGLEKLHQKYHQQGLEILDFPCNQFLGQAPGTNEEIAAFCQTKFGVSFQTFGKIDVNGKHEDPLYTFLKKQKKQDTEDAEAGGFKQKLEELGQAILGDSIKWNFTKFLVDREGNVVDRFMPTYKPEDLDAKIAAIL